MNPKKSKKIYELVSEDLNIKQELVEDLVEFYYKEVRMLLSNLKNPRINIDGLGQFVAKPMIIKKAIDKLHKVLDEHDTSTFKAYHNKKAMENKLELLKNLSLKLSEQATKKSEFFKNKKNEKRT